MKRLLLIAILTLASCVGWAQSNPGFVYGYVPTAPQWNGYFSAKQDYILPGSSGNVLTSNGVAWISQTPAVSGTVTSISVTSANGFTGAVSTPTTTPAITLGTSISGLTKGSGGALAAALSSDVYGLWSGSCTSSTYLRGDGACSTPAGAGSVTTVSVVSANGFGGTVATASTTPAVTLTTSISGPLKGSSSALAAAAAADIYGLWGGSCSSSTFLRGDGTCATPAGAGTVTSVATGSGLTGGTIVGSGTINLANVAATSHQWVDSVVSNILHTSQPSFSDISGTFQGSNWPTLTANAFLTGGGATTQPNAVALTGLVVGNGASAPTSVSAPSGTVVGTSDSQTLSNKTLTTPTVNGYAECANSPAIIAGAVTLSVSACTFPKLSLVANTVITLPSPVAGQSYTVQVCYGGTYTVTWTGGGTLSWPSATAPTATSTNGKCDFYVFVSHDTTYTYGQDGGRNYTGS